MSKSMNSKSARKSKGAATTRAVKVKRIAVPGVDTAPTMNLTQALGRPAAVDAVAIDAKPARSVANERKGRTNKPGSKQSRVITMLQSPSGATIAAIVRATGWQQHSVRGFLAGVVRKRLKLNLASGDVDGTRVYRVSPGTSSKPGARSPKDSRRRIGKPVGAAAAATEHA